MEPTVFTQVGVGGIFVLLLLREVLPFIKAMQGGVTSSAKAGDQTTDYWRANFQEMVANELRDSVIPILRTQTAILERMDARDTQSYEQHLRMSIAVEELGKSLAALRTTTHQVAGGMQALLSHRESGIVT